MAKKDQRADLDFVKALIDLAKGEQLLQLQVGDVIVTLADSSAANAQAVGFSFPDIDPDDEHVPEEELNRLRTPPVRASAKRRK